MRMVVFVVLLTWFLSVCLPSEALNVKSKTFRSPPIFLGPGSVSNKRYYDVAFPRGHLAVKSFDAEVVDENDIPIPLHETYLHHWIAQPYYALKKGHSARMGILKRRNSGVCKTNLGQYFGHGSETRHTATWIPDPYGIEIGNPENAPRGYEEKWSLNIHAIDTRGVIDRRGCTKCRCDLYNVTIPSNYIGGMLCCHDQTQCRVKQGLGGKARRLFFQYTVTWLDWTDAVVPVSIYIIDVTDTALLDGIARHSCKVEYEVEECSPENRAKNECIHVKAARAVLPRGGDIVLATGHQHAGGTGASLHGQDGRLLCESPPIYGMGKEAGNEANYIVGMSTCYPEAGSAKVSDGEVLTIVSNRRHGPVLRPRGLAAIPVLHFPNSVVPAGMDACLATCEEYIYL